MKEVKLSTRQFYKIVALIFYLYYQKKCYFFIIDQTDDFVKIGYDEKEKLTQKIFLFEHRPVYPSDFFKIQCHRELFTINLKIKGLNFDKRFLLNDLDKTAITFSKFLPKLNFFENNCANILETINNKIKISTCSIHFIYKGNSWDIIFVCLSPYSF